MLVRGYNRSKSCRDHFLSLLLHVLHWCNLILWNSLIFLPRLKNSQHIIVFKVRILLDYTSEMLSVGTNLGQVLRCKLLRDLFPVFAMETHGLDKLIVLFLTPDRFSSFAYVFLFLKLCQSWRLRLELDLSLELMLL